MRVAIFGSGPSGLLAAHALVVYGHAEVWDIDIFSRGEKSPLYGCQYLHQPIPAINCGEDVTVKYNLIGSPELYYRKVYGSKRVTAVSPEEYGGEHQAWDIRKLYDQLWDAWQPRVKVAMVDKPNPDEFWDIFAPTYDKIISTIPRNNWCYNEKHNFEVTEIYAVGDAPDLGVRAPFRPAFDNAVICNSDPHVGWYRMSQVFGFSTIEWPGDRKPPVGRVAHVKKPLRTDCNCWTEHEDDVSWGESILFVGRYGEWRKGVLAHDVFYQVRDAFA